MKVMKKTAAMKAMKVMKTKVVAKADGNCDEGDAEEGHSEGDEVAFQQRFCAPAF